MRFLTATNDVFETDNKHYITMFVACRVDDGANPQVCAAFDNGPQLVPTHLLIVFAVSRCWNRRSANDGSGAAGSS